MLPCPWCACWPNGVPGLRMKATRLPSGDHVGLLSCSTLGDRNFTERVRTSYTPISEWSTRLLTKASFDPSGDHLRLLLVPQALIQGVCKLDPLDPPPLGRSPPSFGG